jgi:hypothetical protein
MMKPTMNPDRLAELEEERTFLLRSLTDLEREHAAGDVDEVDYRELKDGYTVRAAATMRAIEDGRSSLPARVEANWTRRSIGVVVVVALIGVVWWALAASSAERTAGQQITGLDPRDRRQTLLAEARIVQPTDPMAAADIYALVLADDPDNLEALTYRGWTLALATGTQTDPTVVTQQLGEAVESLLTASEIDPTYADAHCFLGIIYFSRLRLAEEASDRIDACLEANPPADVRALVERLRAEIDAALDQP